MKTFGLIGYPLEHSFSQKYFTDKFKKENLLQHQYKNFPIERIEQIEDIIAGDKSLIGLNVTIPYKQQVFPYLDEMDETSQKIGAVNTIQIKRTGGMIRLKGYNTDAWGFYHSLKPCLRKKYDSALVLGTGGASKAVAYVLEELGIHFIYISRHPKEKNQISYQDLCGPVLYNFQIIINTSPVGMYPNISDFPDIPYEFITKDHILFDLIYNPEETLFLKKGKERGAQTINGLKMLHLQAERSWEIWSGAD
ncbi:MAG: shikimate dehydrogenase [Bacteroidales bacterium]|nr:shikimate dehydrogenase [Bacteroidales bacterium]